MKILMTAMEEIDQALRLDDPSSDTLAGIDRRIADLIAANPARQWDIAALSRKLLVSERSLSRHFKQQMGQSEHALGARHKMHLAQDMLANHMSVAAVAEAVIESL